MMFLVLNGICEIYIRSNREFLSEHKISRIQINGALIARQFTEDEKEYIEQVNNSISRVSSRIDEHDSVTGVVDFFHSVMAVGTREKASAITFSGPDL